MKKLLICLVLLSLFLSSCAGGKKYRDDLSTEALMTEILSAIPVEQGYGDMPETHFLYYFEDEMLPWDRTVRQSIPAENINEVGIFHTETAAEQSELREELEDYLEDLREEKSAFVASYAPTEVPKLTAACVRSFGSYTVYTVLDPKDQSLVWQAVERALAR